MPPLKLTFPAACRGKTRWWRKAPLELSHSSRSLLAGQRSFYLFCDGSAAKEQWFNAMQWGVADCGGAAHAVEEMYSTFCHSIRQSKGVTYPQVGAPACQAHDTPPWGDGLRPCLHCSR